MAYIDLQAISSHDQTKEPAPLCEPTVVPNAFLTGMAVDVQDMCVRILMCGAVGANAATAPEKWCSVRYGYGTRLRSWSYPRTARRCSALMAKSRSWPISPLHLSSSPTPRLITHQRASNTKNRRFLSSWTGCSGPATRNDFSMRIALALVVLLAQQRLVSKAAKRAADQRSDPEEPELLQCQTTHEKRRSRRARRIDRCIGHGDRDQVDEC